MTRHLLRALAWALATALLLAAAPAGAQTADPGKPAFDTRDDQRVRPRGPADPAAVRGLDRLTARLGRQGVVDIDPATGTPRFVGQLDGFLTGPSGDDPAQTVLGYVRAQRAVFGLSDDDLDVLRLVRRYTDAGGTTHLVWAQTWHGITAWDNSLHASVAADGRIVNVSGSPVPGLASRTSTPDLNASAALARALDDLGGRGLAPRATPRGGADRRTTFRGGHDARLVLFTERAGDVHLAWNVTAVAGPAAVYRELIDAHSGKLLFRASRVDHATVDAFDYFPGAPAGGTQSAHTVPVDSDVALSGPNAHVYPDADDDNSADGEIPASSANTWNYPFTDAWNGTPNSWLADESQNGAQVYYFVNAFHDWLRDEVGFDAASGAFEGADAPNAEVMDGASQAGGLPDADHSNNANMDTPPDGQRPRMQMYLFTNPTVNGGDDATVVYHEYTHGLSGRLITRADGSGALDAHQAGSMGEGWSDWYAMDKLVSDNFQPDTATPGEVIVGRYATGDPTGVREEALDCPVSQAATNCGDGGWTYGDLGKIAGEPEVHADGEIWAQTLWDLRTTINDPAVVRDLVTNGMRLAPEDPSMLEMRNAILQADQAAPFDGAHENTIWQVFANRGMGYFAVSFGGDDRRPRESFATPPPAGSGGTVTGRVAEQHTGTPVSGALVQLASAATGFPGDVTATTDAGGNYAIADAPAGTYPLVVVDAPGHSPGFQENVTVPGGGRTLDAQILRDWASSSGGAARTAFTGPDFGPSGCGPDQAIDRSYTDVWGSTSPNSTLTGIGTVTGPKSITVRLPEAVDVDGFAIDPGAGCGDDDTASTAGFRVETSTDGGTFVPAATGTFGSAADHRPNAVTPSAGTAGVRFVRYTMLTPQRQSTGDAGKQFMDTAEFEVFGVATAQPATPPPAPTTVQPTVTVPAIDRTAPVAKLGLAAGQKLKTALAKGLKVTLSCNEPCSARLNARLDAKTAKKLKLLARRSRAKSVVVASGALRTGSGKRTVTLKFTTKARKLLKRQRSLELTVSGPVTDGAGNPATASRRITIKR